MMSQLNDKNSQSGRKSSTVSLSGLEDGTSNGNHMFVPLEEQEEQHYLLHRHVQANRQKNVVTTPSSLSSPPHHSTSKHDAVETFHDEEHPTSPYSRSNKNIITNMHNQDTEKQQSSFWAFPKSQDEPNYHAVESSSSEEQKEKDKSQYSQQQRQSNDESSKPKKKNLLSVWNFRKCTPKNKHDSSSRCAHCVLKILFFFILFVLLSVVLYGSFVLIWGSRAVNHALFGLGNNNNNNNNLSQTDDDTSLFQSFFFVHVLMPRQSTIKPFFTSFQEQQSSHLLALKTIVQFDPHAQNITASLIQHTRHSEQSNLTVQLAQHKETERLLQRYTLWTLWYATRNHDDGNPMQIVSPRYAVIWKQMTQQHECLWEGVGCFATSTTMNSTATTLSVSNNKESIVSSIQMSRFNLTGTLPWIEIESFLPHLQELNVSYNNLTGTPSQSFLSSLPGLKILDLSHNQFGGDLELFLAASPRRHFPAASSTIITTTNTTQGVSPNKLIVKQLQVLKLQFNQFEGHVSSGFFWSISVHPPLMTTTTTFSTSSTKPSELPFSFPHLKHLDLSWNRNLKGTISTVEPTVMVIAQTQGVKLASLTIDQLEFMSLVGTQITGTISPRLCRRRAELIILVNCQTIACACCQNCPIPSTLSSATTTPLIHQTLDPSQTIQPHQNTIISAEGNNDGALVSSFSPPTLDNNNLDEPLKPLETQDVFSHPSHGGDGVVVGQGHDLFIVSSEQQHNSTN